MIIIHHKVLSLLGVVATPGDFIAPGVYVTPEHGFSSFGYPSRTLIAEKSPSLVCVGVDRVLVENATIPSTVYAVDADGGPRMPTTQEAASILAALENGMVVGPLVAIVEALRRVAATTTVTTTTEPGYGAVRDEARS